MRSHTERKTVLFAGNPNVGKSTIFNALTGMRQHTGNWAGKTVGVASGYLRPEKNIELFDLPGMYSLDGNSQDEKVASNQLINGKWDCVVVVCDGCYLERNLILALQIMSYCPKVILCINLIDEAKRRGIRIDRDGLEQALGIPVVVTSAAKKEGISELRNQIKSTISSSNRQKCDVGNPVIRAKELACDYIVKERHSHDRWRLILDRQLVSPRRGAAILIVLLFVILWLTVCGANYPSVALEYCFEKIYVWLSPIKSLLPHWLSGLLLDGIYSTVSKVISVMLPPLLIFFPLFTLLEDVGYLPRLAFLLERGMHRCGGCGKQALTLCMGLGCNAVGVTSCRIISSPRQRLIAILTNAMIPCNGRFPAMILIGTLLLGSAGGSCLVACCVILGVIAVMLFTAILSHSLLRNYPHEEGFIMEIPPLRCPQLKNIIVNAIIDRTVHVTVRALAVAAPAGAVLWLIEYSNSLEMISDNLEFIGTALGMNGAILAAFLMSFPANELFIPTLLMTDSAMEGVGFPEIKAAVCTLIFMLFHWPCATTLLTVYKETGSLKKTAAAAVLPTAVGIILCLMINLLF